jgi:hypothetical protein
VTNFDRIKTTARGIVTEEIDRRTTDLGEAVNERVTKLRAMSETLRGQGQTVAANLVDSAASKLDGISSYLRSADGDRIIHDVETLARNQPLATAAAGFAGGFVVARLLKAGGNTVSSRSGAAVPLSEDDSGAFIP